LSGTFEEEHIMATRNPNDPRDDDSYRANDPYRPIDPTRPDIEDDGLLRASRLDKGLQPDPELAEGPASNGKIVIAAIAIAVLLGAVFYGLNNSTMQRNGTSSTAQKAAPATAQNTAPASPQAAPSPTPGGNTAQNTKPGTTTGAAPSQTPPPSNPPGNPAPANK
jgi:hypothetical protein